jgi:hypothetical protein
VASELQHSDGEATSGDGDIARRCPQTLALMALARLLARQTAKDLLAQSAIGSSAGGQEHSRASVAIPDSEVP